MFVQRGATAAGKNGDDREGRIQLLLAEERGAIDGRVYRAYQRVADEFHGDACVGVELFFEGEDAEGFGETAADDSYAPWAPGPELRADVIGVADLAGFEFAGEAGGEAGEVGEDG